MARATLRWLVRSAVAATALAACGGDMNQPGNEPDLVEVLGQEVIGDCSTKLTVSPASPQSAGTVVSLASTGSCNAGEPEFKFMQRSPNGKWSVLRDWGEATFDWNTAGVLSGQYVLQALVRTQGSSEPYEGSSAVRVFDITDGASACYAATLSSSPASPQAAGTSVTVTAAAMCTPNTSAEYKFMRREPSGKWVVAQDWSSNNVFNWNTASALGGEHYFQGLVRQQGSTAVYEGASAVITYELRGGVVFCHSVKADVSPASPQLPGAVVTINGAATCSPTGQAAEYQYLVRDTAKKWQVVQPWTASDSFDWNTAGLPAGDYVIQVWTRAQGSSADWEGASSSMLYSLSSGSCPSVTSSQSPPPPRPAGTLVTLTGYATCQGGVSPEYIFLYRGLDGKWVVIQDYSPSSTASWNTTGLAAGTYYTQVWARAQGSTEWYQSSSPVRAYQIQ